MGSRQYPWVLAAVPWSDLPEFTRGTHDGLPLLSWNIAPRAKLATKRQLRALGLRPGGADPVAVLYFRCRKAGKLVFSSLFLIERAKPVQPMTPAKWASQRKATLARRICRECGEQGWAELPKAHRTCEPCRYSLGLLDPADYLHDYLIGTPVTAPAALNAGWVAPVIPIRRSTSDLHRKAVA